jgi:hypothetical protein
MQLEYYTALKARVETLTALKKVGLWDNQFEREPVNVPFLYPCCWIEFTDIVYSDYLKGVQKYDMIVNFHLGFESFKTEDIEILQLKQDLHNVVHTFQSDYNTKLLRRGEVQNFDHTNIQEYILSYETSGKDYFTDPLVPAQIDTLILNTTLSPTAPELRLLESGDYRLLENNGFRLLE